MRLRLELGLEIGLEIGLGLARLELAPGVAQLQQPRAARLAACAPLKPHRHHTHLRVY